MVAGAGEGQQARGVLQGPVHQLRALGMAADDLVQNGHVRRPQLVGEGEEIPHPVVHPLGQPSFVSPGARLLDHRRREIHPHRQRRAPLQQVLVQGPHPRADLQQPCPLDALRLQGIEHLPLQALEPPARKPFAVTTREAGEESRGSPVMGTAIGHGYP